MWSRPALVRESERNTRPRRFDGDTVGHVGPLKVQEVSFEPVQGVQRLTRLKASGSISQCAEHRLVWRHVGAATPIH
jgi:hypothetical protein